MERASFYRGRYADELDAFVFNDGHNRSEIYDGEDFLVGGTIRRLSNLGGRGNWTWQTASQYEGR